MQAHAENSNGCGDKALKGAVLQVWNYYIPTIGRHPKQYTLTNKRRGMGRIRLQELQARVPGHKLEGAVELAKLMIDRMASSDWHMGRDPKTRGKSYNDWEHLFRSTEQMEKWLNDANFEDGHE